MMLRAASTDSVHMMLKTMPLYKFMRYEITELMFNIHLVSTPMQFSMN
jgi:muconolactone delta-isomerase